MMNMRHEVLVVVVSYLQKYDLSGHIRATRRYIKPRIFSLSMVFASLGWAGAYAWAETPQYCPLTDIAYLDKGHTVASSFTPTQGWITIAHSQEIITPGRFATGTLSTGLTGQGRTITLTGSGPKYVTPNVPYQHSIGNLTFVPDGVRVISIISYVGICPASEN